MKEFLITDIVLGIALLAASAAIIVLLLDLERSLAESITLGLVMILTCICIFFHRTTQKLLERESIRKIEEEHFSKESDLSPRSPEGIEDT